MDNLSTTPSEEERKEQSILAFIEVLDVAEHDAQFYLESSAWDIQTAVLLWLENNPRGSSNIGSYFPRRQRDQWAARDVVIEGLDSEWKAKVSKHKGTIYFEHIPTGITQNHVPPGFADAPMDATDVPFSSNGGTCDDGTVAKGDNVMITGGGNDMANQGGTSQIEREIEEEEATDMMGVEGL